MWSRSSSSSCTYIIGIEQTSFIIIISLYRLLTLVGWSLSLSNLYLFSPLYCVTVGSTRKTGDLVLHGLLVFQREQNTCSSYWNHFPFVRLPLLLFISSHKSQSSITFFPLLLLLYSCYFSICWIKIQTMTRASLGDGHDYHILLHSSKRIQVLNYLLLLDLCLLVPTISTKC